MNGRHQQAGMTAIGWLLVLGLIVFFALIGIRLAPVYLESFKVQSALDSLRQEPYVTQKSPVEIRNLLERRFEVDDVDDVDLRKDVHIVRDQGTLKIEIGYERRVHLFGNIDVAAKFNKHTEIVAN